MKAALFYGKGDIRVEDIELSALNPGEVLLKVHACGVCGTDVHVYEGAKSSAAVNPPVILGHEIAGEVVELAMDVRHVRIGDRVSVDPNIFCGGCYYCKAGKTHLCQNLRAVGVTQHGGFAEFTIVPENQLYPLADHVSFEEGALSEPLACCLHGIDLAGIKSGDRVLIIGGGTIGLIMVQLAQHAGAAEIIVSEPETIKWELARSFGADYLINPSTQKLQSEIRQLTGEGVDVAIECVGIGETMLQAVQATCRGGTVLMFGLTPPDCEIPLKPFDVFKNELTIKSSFVNPFTQSRAVRLLETGKIRVKELIAGVKPLADLKDVMEGKDTGNGGKIIIDPALDG